MQTRGGGNCANALTAAARLGLEPYLVSKIGNDGVGEQIKQELHEDGVQTDFLLKAKDNPSPFTYIIVDKSGIYMTPGICIQPMHAMTATVQTVHMLFALLGYS